MGRAFAKLMTCCNVIDARPVNISLAISIGKHGLASKSEVTCIGRKQKGEDHVKVAAENRRVLDYLV